MKGTHQSGASVALSHEGLPDPGSFHSGERTVADGAPAEPQGDSAQSIHSSQTYHNLPCLGIAPPSSTIAIVVSLFSQELRGDVHQGRGHQVLEVLFWQRQRGSTLL